MSLRQELKAYLPMLVRLEGRVMEVDQQSLKASSRLVTVTKKIVSGLFVEIILVLFQR